ncbi:HD domain-containing protein [Pseudoruegeria sp. SHC-113]|uniref:HD domain-containing protein n=1 Tax=Pseudoruegeria sp. SHC-113 TaxID=2855439 RepID=UPI0021BB688E|nr:HD domain-containing protein [Pseudoruegeria sp. SHC-113]MCT8160531.1 HD domain-containing protein [Pseudoruegeria sp. SHC-113]
MTATGTPRLAAQFAFLEEADRLKGVERANVLQDLSRPENSAEHSWHAALFAFVLAESAPQPVDALRAAAMLLLHDLVEIDAGDHPIHIPVDSEAVAHAEAAAAQRLFALLPEDLAQEMHALRAEFEAGQSTDAAYARQIDIIQPIFQVLMAQAPLPDHVEIARDNLLSGRAAPLAQSWPEAHDTALGLLNGAPLPDSDFARRLRFLSEADALKTVLRATPVLQGARPENSAEHSWHLALHALILHDLAAPGVARARIIAMLLLHDLVEIDAGDAPIHAAYDAAAQDAKEQAAAKRLFGLLPSAQGAEFLALWQEFEAAQTPDAIFAKSIDRVQPLFLNLASGGGSWREYNVTLAQLEQRVGGKVARGSEPLWAFARARVAPWFAQEAAS